MEVIECLNDTRLHRLFALADPIARIVVLFVRLMRPLGVAHLGLQILDILGGMVAVA